MIRFARALVALLSFLTFCCHADAPVFAAQVVKVLPHDKQAFTQGLHFVGDRLFESTGLYGRSELRELDPISMLPIRRHRLAPSLFGEGATHWRDSIYQLTWRSGVLLRYRISDFKPLASRRYSGEGWGLTTLGEELVMSDGSDQLSFRDPTDFSEVRRVAVVDGHRSISQINELERVKDVIWANIWKQPVIAMIEPETGIVQAWIDLSVQTQEQGQGGGVANGIAWREGSETVLITGKNWSRSYLVRIPSLP